MNPQVRALETNASQLRAERKALLNIAEHIRSQLDSVDSQLVEIDESKAQLTIEENARLRAATGYLAKGGAR